MMYFNNLLLIMSACGSVALVLYLAATRLYLRKLSPTYRYRLLQLVLAFYLLPFPLLANYLRDFLRFVLRKPDLFSVSPPPGELMQENLYKTIYIKDGKLSLPMIDIVLLCVILFAIAAAVAYLIYYSYRCRQEKRLALLCAEGHTNEAEALLPQSYQTLRQRRHVRICAGPEGVPVFTCGTRHPTVVLEEDERPRNQKFLLMHELMHVRYRDTLFRTLAFLAVALHFYNPLIYLFFQEVKKCMELHCDENVVPELTKDERTAYGHLLINNAMRPQPKLAVPFASNNYSIVKERIALIKSPAKKRILMALLTAIIVIPTALLPALAYQVPHVEVLSAENELDIEDANWACFSEGDEIVIPEEEKYFSQTDALFIDEDGTVTFVSPNEISTDSSCTHNYVASSYLVHSKNSSGGCTVKYYSCKRCKNCGNKINIKLTNKATYAKCPH